MLLSSIAAIVSALRLRRAVPLSGWNQDRQVIWLDEAKPGHGRAYYLRDVRRDEMGVVTFRHSRIRMAQICRDDRQRRACLQKVRGVGVAQDMETRGRINVCATASLPQRPMLV
jgi:hypothetical protein